jgi:hypothetical protein
MARTVEDLLVYQKAIAAGDAISDLLRTRYEEIGRMRAGLIWRLETDDNDNRWPLGR